ncbi:hypothetical protein VNO77_17003 [Canavalia gladiata]|uniref:Uncharacterized protein n=1 Tax=Canavalia gladiata TaxID=3824 RepID=A0AAN9LIX5_CANGL
MGQSLQKLSPGSTSNSLSSSSSMLANGASRTDDRKLKELLEPIIDDFYEAKVVSAQNFSEFYRAVCEIVEELNRKLGNTQIQLPKIDTLRNEYDDHHQGRDKALTKAEFQEIMKNLVKESGFTGIGAKEALLCIFGVPLTALLVKQRVMPQAIANEFFIPGVTSLTVFTLAALNKI